MVFGLKKIFFGTTKTLFLVKTYFLGEYIVAKGSQKVRKAAQLWIFAEEGGGSNPNPKVFEELFKKPA